MFDRSFIQRFWAKVRKNPEDRSACWLWIASLDSKGYGQIRNPNKLLRAHRVSWQLNKGSIPSGLCVLHRCDVRRCVNPDHLFLGTVTDNNRDMTEKGRNAMQRPGVALRGDNHWSRKRPELVRKGEQVHSAVLTEEKVREIRNLYAKGWRQVELTRGFKVSKNVISRIVNNKTWKGV